MIEIDGAMLEGGGQILRVSSALAAVLSVSIRISNIRGGRPKPGLAAQHMAGLQLVGNLIGTSFNGLKKGSQEISIKRPHTGVHYIKTGKFPIDIGTAGAISLVIQSALPVALYAAVHASPKVELVIIGGTDVDFSPPMDYFTHVFFPTLRQLFKVSIECQITKRGFNPRGGGLVVLSVTPLELDETLPPITLIDQGTIIRFRVIAFSAGASGKLLRNRAVNEASQLLKQRRGGAVVEEESSECDAVGEGYGLLVVAESDSGCRWGASRCSAKSVPPEKLALDLIDEMFVSIDAGAVVDEYMEDQLIVYMALSRGESRLRMRPQLSLHTQTAIEIATIVSGARFWREGELLCCGGIGNTRNTEP